MAAKVSKRVFAAEWLVCCDPAAVALGHWAGDGIHLMVPPYMYYVAPVE